MCLQLIFHKAIIHIISLKRKIIGTSNRGNRNARLRHICLKKCWDKALSTQDDSHLQCGKLKKKIFYDLHAHGFTKTINFGDPLCTCAGIYSII